MAFDAALLDLMPDTLVAVPGAVDAFGEWTASGSTVNVPCRVEGRARLVRDLSGKEVVSSVQVYTGGVYSLTVDGHRYTLPSRFAPKTEIQALHVELVADEEGPHHEVVMLP